MTIWQGNILCEEELEELEKNTMFTAYEIEMLYERFNYLDRCHTGFLTFAEFQMIPEFYSNPFSRVLIAYLERSNCFEKVTFASFLDFLGIFSPKTKKQARVSFLFNIFDLDKDKKISADDLGEVQALMTGERDEKLVEEVLEMFDTDKKGHMNYRDFIKFYDSEPSIERNMCLGLGEELGGFNNKKE